MNTVLSETVASLVAREALSVEQRDGMFRLLAEHFEGVTLRQFERDLMEKNWVLLMHREERLVGLSTLLVYETTFKREPVSVVYSGDTIMSREAWGSPVLARAWIAAVNQLRASYPRGKYYWLLLTSGFRTYRFLPVFWREFFPRFDRPGSANEKELLNHLASERFGPQFDANSGRVRFHQPQQLRGELADVPSGKVTNPHVAFFLSQNPGYRKGDELVCLTELCAENLTPAGRRMWASGL